ncbi:MAG: FtsX-like permease family protein, partial [Acidobacteriota bacterium]
AELERLDPTLSSSSAASLAESVSDSLWLPRLAGQVVGVFALAALALAGLGLYGVLAHTVQTRRRELGIRAALGADRRTLVRLVMRQGLGLAAAGTLVGGGVAVVLSGVLDSLLYEIDATDPRIFIVTAAVLLATAGLAAWLPAQRASAADPASCLRQD